MDELRNALTLIKINKAVSLDCTSDFIVKLIAKKKEEIERNKAMIEEYEENLLELINECLTNNTLPIEA